MKYVLLKSFKRDKNIAMPCFQKAQDILNCSFFKKIFNKDIYKKCAEKIKEKFHQAILKDPPDEPMKTYDVGSSHIIFWIIFLFFICFILWASFFEIDEFVHCSGEVETSSQEKIVTHFEGGVINKVFVKEGERVKAGQILVSLKDTSVKASRDDNRDKYFSSLGHVARLKAQLAGKEDFVVPKEVQDYSKEISESIMIAFTSHWTSLKKQKEIIQDQKLAKEMELQELIARENNTKEAIILSEKEVGVLSPLVEKKYVALTQLLRAQKDLIEKKTQLDAVTNNIPKTKAQIEELQKRFDQVVNELNQKNVEEMKQRESDLGTSRARLVLDQDRLELTDIKSPVTGVVKMVHIKTEGSAIQSGKEIVTLIPLDDDYYISANVNPKDIGFIHIGNDTNIKITAFDYSIFGSLKGKVIHISPDAFFDERKQPYFKVKLSVSKEYIEHNNNKLFIFPGMTAQVDILTGKKTVMNYLLKPITKTVSDSMGEK